MNQARHEKQISPELPKKWDLLILSVLLSAGFVRLFRAEFCPPISE